MGPLDVLINNAGLSPLAPSLLETSEDLFDKVIGVNLKGPFRLAALFGSRMAAGEGGAIINVSSTGSIRPMRIPRHIRRRKPDSTRSLSRSRKNTARRCA